MKLNDLTKASREWFVALAEDADNWGDVPLWVGTKKDNGTLTDLKKKGLVKTDTDCKEDGGNVWVYFTSLGAKVAKEELGIEIETTWD